MESLKELVLEAEKAGRIVFMTIDGPMSIDLDKFIRQPIEGLLYDLNRDRATVLSFIDDVKWINDFAVMKAITKLKEILEETWKK